MLAFSVENDDVKSFMNKILKDIVFDNYDVRLVEIESIAKFEIDCTINKDYLYDEDNPNNNRKFCTWCEIKPFVFNIIRGSAKPKFIKIVLSYDINLLENFHPNAKALFLNIYFENNKIKCTTGTSQQVFSLEKDLDFKWDEHILAFFKHNNIFISTH